MEHNILKLYNVVFWAKIKMEVFALLTLSLLN